MAHCVVSGIIDSDASALSPTPACMVHTQFAPCPLNGQPACPVALHSLPGTSRTDALRMWHIRTHKQRPLVIHRVDGRPAEEHDIEGGECPCGPEVLAAEEGN